MSPRDPWSPDLEADLTHQREQRKDKEPEDADTKSNNVSQNAYHIARR